MLSPREKECVQLLAQGYRTQQIAEKLLLKEVSSGAESDLKKASETAFRMVAHWGMSANIGPVAFRRGPWFGKMIAPTEMTLEFGTPAWSAGTRGAGRPDRECRIDPRLRTA